MTSSEKLNFLFFLYEFPKSQTWGGDLGIGSPGDYLYKFMCGSQSENLTIVSL